MFGGIQNFWVLWAGTYYLQPVTIIPITYYARNNSESTNYLLSMVHGQENDHSCPPSSLVSPKRKAGAGVGVGMLRGRGIPLKKNLGFLVSWFQSFNVSKYLGFLVSKFLGFLIYWFLGYKVSIHKFHFMIFVKYWFHITRWPFHVFCKRLISYLRFSRIC